jgi:hypothetical protein
MKIKLETIKFEAYPMGQLFPEEWRTWIFDLISDDAPFSWGDNDHTLISVDRFKSWFDEVMSSLDSDETALRYQVDEKLAELEQRGAYIELES